jgi:hypothetical protein
VSPGIAGLSAVALGRVPLCSKRAHSRVPHLTSKNHESAGKGLGSIPDKGVKFFRHSLHKAHEMKD